MANSPASPARAMLAAISVPPSPMTLEEACVAYMATTGSTLWGKSFDVSRPDGCERAGAYLFNELVKVVEFMGRNADNVEVIEERLTGDDLGYALFDGWVNENGLGAD